MVAIDTCTYRATKGSVGGEDGKMWGVENKRSSVKVSSHQRSLGGFGPTGVEFRVTVFHCSQTTALSKAYLSYVISLHWVVSRFYLCSGETSLVGS